MLLARDLSISCNLPPMFITTPRVLSAFAATLLLSSNVAFAAEPAPKADTSALLTRADFIKLIIDHTYTDEEMKTCFAALSPSNYQLLFTDVSTSETYAKELCVAMKTGIVRGYQDGSFRPNQPINFAEASKVYTRAFSLSPAAGITASVPWYRGSVEALAARGAIPNNVKEFAQPMTYLTQEEILRRLTNDITYLDSKTYDSLIAR